jgi:transcriptional regulator with XRE-family HTH domain
MGIPIGHGGRPLSEFGTFLERELKARSMTLKELAEHLPCKVPALSRYLRGRRPPEDVVEAIVKALKSGKEEAETLRQTVDAPTRPASLATRPQSMRRSVRQFGYFTLQQLSEQLARFGWNALPCEVDDEFSYDLKVSGSDHSQGYVLLNLLQPSHRDPQRLLRAVRAQWVNESDAKRVLYLEPFAGSCELPVDQEGDLFSEGEATELMDAWLFRESEELGRVVHGGNMISVLAEELGQNKAVKAYLKRAMS